MNSVILVRKRSMLANSKKLWATSSRREAIPGVFVPKSFYISREHRVWPDLLCSSSLSPGPCAQAFRQTKHLAQPRPKTTIVMSREPVGFNVALYSYPGGSTRATGSTREAKLRFA